MNTLKTIAFAALAAVTIASPAAATTVLTYVGADFTFRGGTEPFGDRLTATIELADPLGANFSGAVSWLSFTISDGVHTLSAPFASSRTLFATNGAGQIVNWRVSATINPDSQTAIDLSTANNLQGQFGGYAAYTSDSAVHNIGISLNFYSFAESYPAVGTWTATTLADPGAIPEPATWALMIAGFGLAGTALRRRRAVVA
ncbi:MAG: PEPxxWA-CTERM sorting domain-containing protein [Alphaproteobacteria bacterium]|nr:PEPxxWA-CTERM sorting domain-containing protein [Alphaproteobacteria bacterium]MBU1512917.1 PEPxxWA-CTERM sorting domain-containing protein [Alphaproteobacteria bacterium]MBU2096642.1 PEPxxWA-CTERM sorting domain-containing protein [Alphaproteobacteria bacterium]MBU2150525.1 PEPxxWA-CTERM sorting domain-containing protein [Alphaproteobacteria bacterium]MBU2306546.1 PEPxxWA-CTERM sorting domain-containing protein [Alphaproteobacteria bacterium]